LPLLSVKCTDFRCLEGAALEFGAGNNLIFGANASGKTSILEAVGYLGRGRSFRGANTRDLVRHGSDEFLVVGKANTGTRTVSIGVRNSRSGLEVHADGEKRSSAAALAEALPLQIIDPDIHDLVAGGPENRRRYIDWMAFHVEHGYLETWRRFRRALKQRNAALRAGTNRLALNGWDHELAELGVELDSARRRVLDIVRPSLVEMGEGLLRSPIDFEYRRGWAAEFSLADAIAGTTDRDIQLGSTQAGPHRADMKLVYDERQARKLVSRGQQKLLACALILAATEVVQTHLEKPLLLLLDDPSAELDEESVGRLMSSVEGLGCQVIATTLDRTAALFSTAPTLFHVEQGRVERVF